MKASDCRSVDLQPEFVSEFSGTTVMVIGRPGTGKSMLAKDLATQLAARGTQTALLCADMGQPIVGIPSCMALSMSPPWDRATRLWFVGDTTPVGNLVPALAGVWQLMREARTRFCRTVVLDTTGFVDGPVARLLKYHKALAADVRQIVALERDSELDSLLSLLDATHRNVHRVRPAEAARDRSLNERRRYREHLLAESFSGARVIDFPSECLIGSEWTVGAVSDVSAVSQGTLVGLLDVEGYCLGVGLIERIATKYCSIATSYVDPEAVVRIQVGRAVLDRKGRQLR